jgi:ABC-type lipoprotein export system ATPase subunit
MIIRRTQLGQETTNWVLDQLKDLGAEGCRFVVMGTSHSGKSTLLSLAVSLFFQKLQLSSEIHSYLKPSTASSWSLL